MKIGEFNVTGVLKVIVSVLKPCIIKGAGGGPDLGMGKIEFDAVFDREKCKLSDAFYGIKKYCS